jgi:ferredoxin-NADP reductase/predicted pyridoxine 5'-phosphate oxidase superfamily flavin-nucleotide-binding protein
VNGRVANRDGGVLAFAVEQSFGNCPQYIHPREWTPAPVHSQPVAQPHEQLTPELRRWIERADTFFIASGHRAGDAAYFGMDASHRGGEPGFVQVLDEHTLVWPDYAGNNLFNTLGNLLLDPRVGLLFVDFEHGHLLQLSGRAAIDWDSAEVAQTPGARRLVTVTIEAVVELRDALPIRWNAAGAALRSLRISEKRRESADVTSFILQARDGGALPDFEPGQHLPLEVAIPGRQQRVSRTYSLSAAPNGQSYRLSIKREPYGLVSRFLHDVLEQGDLLSAATPAGDFILRPGIRPVVLISAGVGVTPMMSMLGALTHPDEVRPVWFIHGVRHKDYHPLAREVREAAAMHDRIHTCFVYSRPRPQDIQGRDYDRWGHIDGDLIETLLPGLDADFYLCGPPVFLAQLSSDLTARGVADGQIYSETFGPLG